MPLAAMYRIATPTSATFLTADHYTTQADAEAAAASIITNGDQEVNMVCVLGLVSQVSISTEVTAVGS